MKLVTPVATLLFATLAAAAEPMTIHVDATGAAGRLFHAHESIPVSAGPLTLYYPKWIPGEHGPTGPLIGLAGLKFTAAGKAVAWKRDPLEMYAFHLTVPSGATALEVDLDSIAPSEGANFTAGATTTQRLAMLSWNAVLLYPQAEKSDAVRVRASLQLPAGWKYATALERKSEANGLLTFEESSLTTLVDSPVLMGVNVRRVEVASASKQPHAIDFAADSPASLETPDDFARNYGNLIDEAGALFGARHYRHYDWLVSLSDHVAHFGLEHHESSDDRMSESTLREEPTRKALAQLLAHEYVHSWNGKYRRPAGLAVGNYDQPMQGDLLWVYEGLTQYLGKLLPWRAGIWNAEEYREALALTASRLTTQTGRTWRPLADTAVEAQILYNAPPEWAAFRRDVAFYEEGVLLWLDVDMTLRSRSGGKKSLDDFCRAFYGGESGHAELKPYEFNDVVAALNAVVPFDWATFLNTRLTALDAAPPVGGITASGWRVVYNETVNSAIKRDEDRFKSLNFASSLGMLLKEGGEVADVIPASPAARAGITPGMQLLALNGRKFTAEQLRDAIKASTKAPQTMQFIVQDGDFFSTRELTWNGGFRYPHLERIPGQPDLLAALGKPLRK